MNHFLNRAKYFLRSEDGTTATEYALMLALIILVSVAALSSLSTSIKGVYSNTNNAIGGAAN